MGHRQVEQAELFYEFSLEKHIPPDHLLRSIDKFVEFSELRRELAGFSELMIRMLLIGYCFCCPTTPARKVPRSIHEGARDIARRIATSWQGRISRRLRKKVEMLFAHLKRILRLDRLRLRGPNGARDEFILAATAQNLRKLAKLIPMPSPTAA